MQNTDDYGYDYVDLDELESSHGGGGFLLGTLTGAAVASALVYLLDPQSGHQRRERMRRQAHVALQRGRHGIDSARHYAESAREYAGHYAEEGRSRLGKLRGNGGAARAHVYGTSQAGLGQPNMRSPLQGSSSGRGFAREAQHWMDQFGGSQLASGAAGLGLAGWGLSRRGPLGLALAALGVYLVASTANERRGRHIGGGVEIDEEVRIDAPVSEVFRYLKRIENWPQFMSHVESITTTGDRRSHWVVEGPAGVPVEWDSEITEEVEDQRICWCTLPGSQVDSEGVVECESDGQGGTRVRVHMIYSPPAGAAGHVFAKLFGRDAGREMADDLQRLKQAVEGGTLGASSSGVGGVGGQQGSTSGSPTH